MWIFAVIFASILQVARNAFQKDLMGTSGPWGATLVRFLFGLPFSWVFASLAWTLIPDLHPSWGKAFWSAVCLGALAQVLATACLLVSMQRIGFAVGTTLQQSALPLSAVIGSLVFHDVLSLKAWFGVIITTVGLAVLSTLKGKGQGPKSISGGLFGLASGFFFGFSLNAFRHASLSLESHHLIFAALMSVAWVQTIQASCLTAILAISDRRTLIAVIVSWRKSLAAGCCGTGASVAWFFALAMTPAVAVRAVGIIEAPIAAIVARRFFREYLHPQQLLAGSAVIAGVLLTVF